MYIKRILVLLKLFVVGYGVSYAQDAPRVVAGEWEMVKMETKLLSQNDDHLLEQKTLTKPEEFKHVTGFIPATISVEGEVCKIITARGFMETGRYKLDKQGVLYYQKMLQQTPQNSMPGTPVEAPYMPFYYQIQPGGVLVLKLPGASFMDTGRGLPVVLECTGYYKKKQ
jgi:hypothetical protein